MISPSFSYWDRTTNCVYASCIEYGKGSGMIAIGDNFGFLRILSIKHSDYTKMVSISNVSSSKIKSLCFDVTQNLLLVHRQNNEVTVFNTNKRTKELIPLLCVQKAMDMDSCKESRCLVQKSYLLQHGSSWQKERDSQCWIGTTNSRKRIVLRVFHLNPLSTNLRNHPLRFENKVCFEIPEGVISDFVVHPSEEYVCIASSIGNVYLYHLLTVKLCAVIRCDHHCLSLSFDPSGLYLCCVLIADLHKGAGGGDRVNVYQVGTQEFVGEIDCIGSIRHCTFSEDGGSLYVSGHRGILKSLTVPKGMRRNIQQTLKGMQSNNHFWSSFPFNVNVNDHANAPMDTYKNTDLHLFDEQQHQQRAPSVRNRRKEQTPIHDDDRDLQGLIQRQYGILTTPSSQKSVDAQSVPLETEHIPWIKERPQLTVGSHLNSHHLRPRSESKHVQIEHEDEDQEDMEENMVPIHTYSKLDDVHDDDEDDEYDEDEVVQTQYVESAESENLQKVIAVSNDRRSPQRDVVGGDVTAFSHLLSINAMIEDSQDTELALLDEELTESRTKTMLSQFNSTLKQFDDFDWSDSEEAHKSKYAPIQRKRKKEEKVEAAATRMCRDLLNDIVDKIGDKKLEKDDDEEPPQKQEKQETEEKQEDQEEPNEEERDE